MMACDMCGKFAKELKEVRSEWRVGGVHYVCCKCTGKLEKVIKIYHFTLPVVATQKWIRRYKKKQHLSPWFEKLRSAYLRKPTDEKKEG